MILSRPPTVAMTSRPFVPRILSLAPLPMIEATSLPQRIGPIEGQKALLALYICFTLEPKKGPKSRLSPGG